MCCSMSTISRKKDLWKPSDHRALQLCVSRSRMRGPAHLNGPYRSCYSRLSWRFLRPLVGRHSVESHFPLSTLTTSRPVRSILPFLITLCALTEGPAVDCPDLS